MSVGCSASGMLRCKDTSMAFLSGIRDLSYGIQDELVTGYSFCINIFQICLAELVFVFSL